MMPEAWQEDLTAFLQPSAVLVGVGNRLRGDDAFGPLLVDRLRDRTPWPVWDSGEAPEGDIGRIASFRPSRVVLLDVVAWGVRPGDIAFFRSEDIPWQGISTHGLSLRMVSDLLACRAGCPVALLGAEPLHTELGMPLSEEVGASLERIARFLVEIAGSLRAACG